MAPIKIKDPDTGKSAIIGTVEVGVDLETAAARLKELFSNAHTNMEIAVLLKKD